jgi:hypothetical protein
MRARIDKKEKAVCTHNLNETVKELNYESIYKGQLILAQRFISGKCDISAIRSPERDD